MSPTVNLLDLPAISGCYLFPQARRVDDPFLVDVPGATLACYRQVHDPNWLTVVHFHGNGEAVADYVPWLADEFADRELNSLFVEYREYGGSTGKARLVAMLGDGEAALAAAALDPRRAIAFGRSIGSLYAIELALRQPSLAGLILESGIADPAERFLTYADLSNTGIREDEVAEEARRRFDHEQKLAGYRNPLLVLHAEHDGLVDISHAERNYRWAASDRKQLVRFATGDHNSLYARNRGEYLAALARFVRSVERPT